MLLWLCLIIIAKGLIEKELQQQVFKLQLHSPIRLIELPNATNIHLLPRDNQCSIKYQSITVDNKTQQIIQEDAINGEDFDLDNPLNFRQFISIATIDRNVFLITSDQVFYWIQIKSFDNPPFFQILWKSDLQNYAPDQESKSEFPQLVVSNSTNLGFIFYSGGNALTFNLSQMENNKTIMLVHDLRGLNYRGYRGVTQELNSYLFSAVGVNGLEIYKIERNVVRFIKYLNDMNVVDLKVLYNTERQEYLIYILDEYKGIHIYSFHNEVCTFLIVIPLNGTKIALDTSNGINIFVACKIHKRYTVNMIIVDAQFKNYEIITQLLKIKINDIKVSNQYIIVQGTGYHRILFYTKYGFKDIDNKVFIHLGLRDFTFYEQNQTDFIIGMTKENVFFSKLKIQDNAFYCAISNSSSQLRYRLSYNIEQFNKELNLTETILIGQNITINVVEVYFFENLHLLIIFLILFVVVVIIVSLCFLMTKWKSIIFELEKQIKRISHTKTSTVGSQELLMEVEK